MLELPSRCSSSGSIRRVARHRSASRRVTTTRNQESKELRPAVMLERRVAITVRNAESVEIRPQRIRDLICTRGVAEHRMRKRIDGTAMGRQQMTPRVGVAEHTSNRERQVTDMNRVEKVNDVVAAD